MRPPRLVWLPAAAAAAAYAVAALRAGFTSEDFLLLRVLGEAPPWRNLVASFAEPWLGLTVVEFWRPVATLLLALERTAFGGWAPGYHLVHAAVHALNATLVARLAGTWPAGPAAVGDERPPATPLAAATAGVLFAIHPLHPNAVVFVGSFATLFSASFSLAALLAYRRFRRGGGAGRLVAAVAFAGLALGSYEAAAVLPAALIAAELLPGAPAAPPRRRLAAVAAFVALTGLYLLGRKALFGGVVGGYAATADRLLALDPATMARDLLLCLGRLVLPVFAPAPGVWASAGLGLVVTVALAAALRLACRRGLPSPGPPAAFALAWIVLGLAPFAFQPFVPGNGRYAYLPVAGLCWLVGALVPAFAAAGRRVAFAGWGMIAALAVAWLGLLIPAQAVQLRAGDEAGAVRRALLEAAGGIPRPGRLFVSGHPDFLRNGRGVPLAAVLRYGLDDALRPPFSPLKTARGVEVYPLPAGVGRPPGVEAHGVPVAWDRATGRLAAAPARPALPALAAEPSPAGGPLGLRFRPLAGASSHDLVFLTRGNPGEVALDPRADAGGWAAAAVPGPFVDSMDRLYGPAAVFWWIEARGPAGEVLAASPLATLQNRSLSP